MAGPTMPRWLLYTIATMLLWGGWGALLKPLSTSLSAWHVQMYSTLGLLPVMALLAFSPRLRHGSSPRRGFLQGFIGGLIGSAGNIGCSRALAEGGKAATVIPLTALYPVVTIFLGMAVLRERLSAVQAAGIAASLAATAFFNSPGDAFWLSPWLLFALVPIVLWGTSGLLQKLSTRHASSELAALAFLAGFIPPSLIIPIAEPPAAGLPGGTWLLLILLGLLFALGNLTAVFAYGSGGKAAIVTPLAGLYPVITVPIAVAFLGEGISAREWAGIFLALAAVAMLCREPKQASAEGNGIDPTGK